MRLTSSWHLVGTEATGVVKTVSEQALGQNLGRTRHPHTAAVGLMPSAHGAVLTLPLAQVGKLRPGPTRCEIKVEVSLSQNAVSSDTQCLLKFGIAPVILISREKQWASW